MAKKHTYEKGTQVKYTAKFLQSVGGATGWARSGEVLGVSEENPDWIRVRWDDKHENLVNAANIMPYKKPDYTGM